MDVATTPLGRRRSVVAAAAALGLLSVMPGAGAADAATKAPHRVVGGGCPAAESLVPHTTWHKRVLAHGVAMTYGTTADSRGTVNMHVLRVNTASKNVSVRPLLHSVAQRSPLSTLAKGHPDLVAATNTGFFDFRSGAPTDPLIAAGKPLVISAAHEPVVGLTAAGQLESGKVWWSATVTGTGLPQVLSAMNETDPPTGLALYTARWGSAPVPADWNTVSRTVVNGMVSSGILSSRHAPSVPSGGYLLVAHGQSASDWLSALSSGTKLRISASVKTHAPTAFRQAYGVGVQLVATKGVARTGFSCNSANTKQPARTAIGFANGGHTMVIALVADDPYTSMHGLDNDQMAKLMAQLGVSQAFAFDGSGSTELLAKLHGSSSLALQNYPADGQEREMPVGLGVATTRVKAKKKKTKH